MASVYALETLEYCSVSVEKERRSVPFLFRKLNTEILSHIVPQIEILPQFCLNSEYVSQRPFKCRQNA